MKFYVYFIFIILFFSCSTFKEIILETSEIPEFIKKPEKQISYINFTKSSIHQPFKEVFEDSIKETLVIHLEQIEIASDLLSQIEKHTFYHSISWLIEYLLKKIQEKYPHIIFVSHNSNLQIQTTHKLSIKIIPIKKNSDSFFHTKESLLASLDIEFQIVRINNDSLTYNIVCKCIEIKNEHQRYVHIKQPDTSLLPIFDKTYLKINFNELEKFVNEFQPLGMGYLSILSASKSEVLIKSVKNQVLFKGLTPTKATLLEGQYQVYIINKNNNSRREEVVFLREGENKNLVIKWDDEQTSSYLNLLSNKRLSVIINDEYKGFTPVYITEIYQGNYHVQILKPLKEELQTSNEYGLLYEKDLVLKENSRLNLFYPLDYYISFKDLKENQNTHYWFTGKSSSEFEEEQFKKKGLLLKPGQNIYSSEVLLDELRGEFTLSCKECDIIFFFENDILFLKKIDKILLIYQGKDILKRQKVYQIPEKNENIHIYFDQSNKNYFYLFINTYKVFQTNVQSNYLTLNIIDKKGDTLLNEFYLNEKGYKNFILKSFYFLGKKLSNIFHNQFNIR